MDDQREKMTATPPQRFAAWLRGAMRRAGMDIDSRMGGGRAELADRVGVSRSTITRWLTGQSMPDPVQFEPVAEALGVPVVELLVGSGIISAKAAHQAGATEPRPQPLSPEEALNELGVVDPWDQAAILALIERLRTRRGE